MNAIPHSRPTLGDEEARAAAAVVASGNLAEGTLCREFSEQLAKALGRRHVVVVANGHQALELWLESLDLPPGSVVRMPSYTCAALRHACERRKLTPLIEDVEAKTLGLGLEGSQKATATIAVNMFAIPCAAAQGDALEDCAMGFVPGVTGTRSKAVLLSFYATKMLTTGQGGALGTDDDNLAECWRDLLQYDNRENYRPTTNRSLTDLQAAIGLVQLKRYPNFLQRRRELLARYQARLTEVGAPLHPCVEAPATGVLFRLPLQVPRGTTGQWLEFLAGEGIEAKRPVWRPLHRDTGDDPACYPVSEEAQETIVSLPFYPSLRDQDVDRVVSAVGRAWAQF